MNHKYAQVIVDIPDLDTRTFSYLIPDELQEQMQIGIPVLVPFGNRGVVNAFVVGFTNYLPDGINAKPVYEILDDEPLLSTEYLQMLEWAANYYCCDIQTVIDAAIPGIIFPKIKKVVQLNSVVNFDKLAKIEQKIVEFLRLKPEISVNTLKQKLKIPYSPFYTALRKLKKLNIVEINNIVEGKKAGPKLEKHIRFSKKADDSAYSIFDKQEPLKLTARQQAIIDKLQELGSESPLTEFLKLARTTSATLKNLEKAGIIEIFDREIFRNPAEIFNSYDKKEFLKLTAHQQAALNRIRQAIEEKAPNPLLLYGVTGSGKTEVYIHAVKEALARGKSVIILAPEIILASQLALRFSEKFGAENVAIWHSSISSGEKHDVWKRVNNGEIRIIIGARSAIFAPVKDLGLIVIDEEHESSYKQTSPAPRYNAKTIAEERARREGAAFVLGTATPDVATYFRAANAGSIIELPERVGSEGLPDVKIIDMTEEYRQGNKGIFSRSLKKSLLEEYDKGRQSILLINRRGFSTYGQCINCGYNPKCKRCDIPLILHKSTNQLRCHYCNYEIPVHDICPSCNSAAIKYYGMGTQKVEELFKEEFPQMIVSRIDSDVMTKKHEHIKILNDFSNGKIDVLIGTQMIAKGLDVHNVTLVGVISSDSLFNIPDYRGNERGFQLLTQVAGRAGRGEYSGKVYFQTYTPEFFAMRSAKEQDFMKFYEFELQSRNDYSYPPFSGITRLIISSKLEIKAIKYSTDVAYRLKLLLDERGLTERLEVLGPTRCIITRIKDEYRFQILIKNTLGESGQFIVTNYIKELKIPMDIKFLVDVDPSDML